MERFKRVERSTVTTGVTVPGAECGRMMAYDQAWIGAAPFKFYHEACAQRIEAEEAAR